MNNLIEKEIDHQKMYFFREDQWEQIIANERYNGCALHPIQIKKLKNFDFPLSKHYEEIVLAGAIEKRGNRTSFMNYALVIISDYYQRVDLLTFLCPNCLSRIAIATPFVSDIYFGIPLEKKNIGEIWNKAREFELKKDCPCCAQTTISQDAIWVGKIPFDIG